MKDRPTLSHGRLFGKLDPLLTSQTIERARCRLNRRRKSVLSRRTRRINDIDLSRWKEYDPILTDSLWVIDRRDSSGVHGASYWGNFIPQIPRQMMWRYTKKGDWILDPFLGSGTTLIECKRMGRNGLGVELNAEVAKQAEERIGKERGRDDGITQVVVGDSRTVDLRQSLEPHGITQVQLLIMHPPYHDIIRFSGDRNDLSNAVSMAEFLSMFGQVLDHASAFLETGRFLAVVIGDKYAKGEWVPLGFRCMTEVLKRDYTLKSLIVKNFDETRGKRNQKELWRYRALAGGFYVFKHEYVLIFQKNGDGRCH